MLVLKIALAATLVVTGPPLAAAVFLSGVGAIRRLVKGRASNGGHASGSARTSH